jgi:hypothetical protein
VTEPQANEESTTENLEERLDPGASKALRQLRTDLYEALLAEARRLSEANAITEDDVYRAYQRLSFPDRNSLAFADAQSVVSQALRENRAFEWVSYGMAVVLFLFGLVLLGAGVVSGDVATRVGALFGGSIVEILILIPFRIIVNSRRQNIALRMLGVILNRVHDPKKVAPLLKDTFLAVVLGKAHFKGVE